MAGYQTIEALRPILRSGPPAAPVVSRELVRPKVVAKRRKFEALSPSIIAEIIARRQNGESYGKIGKDLNVGAGSIRKFAGHVPPPAGGWKNCWQTGGRKKRTFNLEFAARLRRAGFSYDEIGQELGCSNWTVILLLDPSRKRRGGRAPVSETLRHVAIVTGFNRKDLRKVDGHSTREADLTKARHIAFWVLRIYRDGLSYPVIGKSLGGYDHSTVINGFIRADRVAKVLGITPAMKPRTAVRALWLTDWSAVSQ